MNTNNAHIDAVYRTRVSVLRIFATISINESVSVCDEKNLIALWREFNEHEKGRERNVHIAVDLWRNEISNILMISLDI